MGIANCGSYGTHNEQFFYERVIIDPVYRFFP